MKTSLIAEVRARIWGTANAWSPESGRLEIGPVECTVTLRIDGGESGYHLVQAPDGFFTTDSWHESLEGAIKEASELYGIKLEDWVRGQT